MKMRLLVVPFILFAGQLCGFGSHTFFGVRSQAANTARDLVGTQGLLPRLQPLACGVRKVDVVSDEHSVQRWGKDAVSKKRNYVPAPLCDKSYVVLSSAVEYSRSFHSDRMREFLFGCNKCLVFSGSRSEDRAGTDILADYFGLPADFKSTVKFDPVISNVVVDINAFWGLDDWLPGLYLRLNIPLVHTRWDLRMCETVDAKGEAFHPAGYMGPVRLDRNKLAANVKEALAGDVVFGDMRDPLRYGKVCRRQKLTQLAEVHGMLGWNFVSRDWWHMGIALRGAARTCGASTAEYLFEPIVGNGGHWELGIGLTSHWDVCQGDNHKFAVYCDANITHLFGADQLRSYDLKNNGNGSRYMLLQHFDSPSYDLLVGGDVAPNQYQGCLSPVINQTTLKTNISVGIQADVVFKLAYHLKNWEFDVGYNFYGRSAESCGQRDALKANAFALKGDAQMYGFLVNKRVPLNVSQSEATINSGQGLANFVSGSQFVNANADNPASVTDDDVPSLLLQLESSDAIDAGIVAGNINSSAPPVLLSDSDINICSGLLPRAISHKVFFNMSHIWRDALCVTPYISGGTSVEWAKTKTLKNSAHSQWALWLKGGITY